MRGRCVCHLPGTALPPSVPRPRTAELTAQTAAHSRVLARPPPRFATSARARAACHVASLRRRGETVGLVPSAGRERGPGAARASETPPNGAPNERALRRLADARWVHDCCAQVHTRSMWNDRQYVLAAVQKNGFVLRYAAPMHGPGHLARPREERACDLGVRRRALLTRQTGAFSYKTFVMVTIQRP